jgi:hypothetical protein
MSLRETTHEVLKEIMNDVEVGGDEITITSPAGLSQTFKSFTNDIFQSVDPGTGQIVSGRVCTISVLISELIAIGFDAIRGIPDENSKPWVVETTDVNDRPYKFKICETHPDNGAGLVLCFLEIYQ